MEEWSEHDDRCLVINEHHIPAGVNWTLAIDDWTAAFTGLTPDHNNSQINIRCDNDADTQSTTDILEDALHFGAPVTCEFSQRAKKFATCDFTIKYTATVGLESKTGFVDVGKAIAPEGHSHGHSWLVFNTESFNVTGVTCDHDGDSNISEITTSVIASRAKEFLGDKEVLKGGLFFRKELITPNIVYGNGTVCLGTGPKEAQFSII